MPGRMQFRHSLSEIVSAAGEAGLRVTELREHSDVSCSLCVEHIQREHDGRYRHRVDGQPLPVLFTLIASA